MTQENSSKTLRGRVSSICVQRADHVDELGWLSPSTGGIEGPSLVFYVVEEAESADVFLLTQNSEIFTAPSEAHDWNTVSVCLNNIKDELEDRLEIDTHQTEALLFYLAANITDEAEDIESANYVDIRVPHNDAGQIDAADHFDSAEQAANRIWISVAHSIGDIRVTLEGSTGEIDLPTDSSDWLEVIAWSKQQLS